MLISKKEAIYANCGKTKEEHITYEKEPTHFSWCHEYGFDKFTPKKEDNHSSKEHRKDDCSIHHAPANSEPDDKPNFERENQDSVIISTSGSENLKCPTCGYKLKKLKGTYKMAVQI